MIKVPITDEMKALAREGEAVYLKNHDKLNFKKGDNPTGLEYKDRFYTGELGEVAFWELLKQHNIKAEWLPITLGSDKGDFKLYFKALDNNVRPPAVIDVKTSRQPEGRHYYEMQVMDWHIKRREYPAYVGVLLVGDIAEVWGYANISEMHKSKIALVPSQSINYTSMRPIEDLLSQLMKGNHEQSKRNT